MINSYEEAQSLYLATEAKRRELEIVLRLAQAGAQRAKQKLQCARKRLTKAEFQAGKLRNMIKNSGFSEVLQQRAAGSRPQPLILFYSALHPFPAIFNHS
jgi:hypothetical protein